MWLHLTLWGRALRPNRSLRIVLVTFSLFQTSEFRYVIMAWFYSARVVRKGSSRFGSGASTNRSRCREILLLQRYFDGVTTQGLKYH